MAEQREAQAAEMKSREKRDRDIDEMLLARGLAPPALPAAKRSRRDMSSSGRVIKAIQRFEGGTVRNRSRKQWQSVPKAVMSHSYIQNIS